MKSKTLKSLTENVEGAFWLWVKIDTNHQEDGALKPYVVLGKHLYTCMQGDTQDCSDHWKSRQLGTNLMS